MARADAVRGTLRRGAPDAPWLVDYAFMLRSAADVDALLDADLAARRWGVSILEALFAAGKISEDRYARDLAASLGVHFADDFTVSTKETNTGQPPYARQGRWRGADVLVVVVTTLPPAFVAHQFRIALTHDAKAPIVFVTERRLRAVQERTRSRVHLRTATSALRRAQPIFSARGAAPRWQLLLLLAIPGLLLAALVADPNDTLAMMVLMSTLPFLGTVLVRVVALVAIVAGRGDADRSGPRLLTDDRDLPVYSILIALFKEVEVLPDLIAALMRLDYPLAKLDCLLVIEDVDHATKLAFLDRELPAWMRVVIVPDGAPRTKPRALNYALNLARGEYVVIYDAEDRPEPDQLRRAYAAFRSAGPRVACVQARLNIFNPRQSWLTRQFTVEYSALFDAVLPALQSLCLPMPLGGTSNHFPRAFLVAMHGWDPWNVTEDADLGIRIARIGREVAMISSTTWEEAPVAFGTWLRQRTRWLKGWMQTYLVHTRRPFGLMRDLGFFRALGFHLYLGGLILSALVHPVFYVAVGAAVFFDLPTIEFGPLGPVLWALGIGNLAAGYLTSIIVGIVAVRRRGHRLVFSALMMPLYWLLISMAAYRAIWQLMRDPYLWEKTPHGLADDEL